MIIKARTKKLIEEALKEDIGSGDVTTKPIIAKGSKGNFIIIAKEPCVVCGMALIEACFETIDNDIHFRPMVSDGMEVVERKVIAHIEGRSHSILKAERTALNFLGWLSGISTLTSKFVKAVSEFRADILDTRKTTPTFRYLEKYAVMLGGGKNHRAGLYDQVLIKDNHLTIIDNQLKALGKQDSPVKCAINKAKKCITKNQKIEIEVNNLAELKEALECNPDIIMLDNMDIERIKEAVKIRDSFRVKRQDLGFKSLLEVSGNVKLDNVAKIAATGIDRISIGTLTHSAPSTDFSMKAE